jgi:hypothetical protein
MTNPWEALREEFSQQNGPGKLWLHEIKSIAVRKIRKLRDVPPSTFGLTNWDVDELVQIVLVERLLGRNQAAYVYEVAETIEDARKLLSRELNIALDVIRVPNQVDNIWKNLEPKLLTEGWKGSKLPELGSQEEESITKLVIQLILNQKRLKNQGTERLSPLFSAGVLDNLAKEILSIDPALPSALLMRSLREALTIISPALSIESVGSDSQEFDHSPMNEGELTDDWGQLRTKENEIVQGIRKQLDIETIEICFQLANKASQSEIASVLGISRPTAKKRIDETKLLLVKILNELELDDQEKVKVFTVLFDQLGFGTMEGSLIK